MISSTHTTDLDQPASLAISAQHALNAARLGSWQYDPLREVFSWDGRTKEILDTPASGATAQEVMSWVHPDDAGTVRAGLDAGLDPAEPRRLYGVEFRIIRRGDGEVRWVETMGLTSFEGDGRVRRAVNLVGTIADITERKEREEKLHLLMREVNHRARNILSVVNAIAHQTVAGSTEDYVGASPSVFGRWQPIGTCSSGANGMGSKSGIWPASNSRFADLIGSRIVMQGAKLFLNPASAQAIGLAFHELATNAMKYGALSRDTGRVDIGWGTDGDTLTISWTERDGPPVSRPKQRGFGSTVMEAMAEQTVGGKVDLDYAPSGVTWRLTCPAANALSADEAWKLVKLGSF